MSRAVTPELALSYLRELSFGLRGAAVSCDGEVLAGDRDLPGDVVRARAEDVEVALSPGPFALPGLAQHDAELVARALTGGETPA